MESRPRLILSTITFWIGLLVVIAAVANAANGKGADGSLETGLGMVVGTLAYRSLKFRLLKAKQDRLSSKIFEVACLCINLMIMTAGFLQGKLWFEEPLSFIVVPIWSFFAYAITLRKGSKA